MSDLKPFNQKPRHVTNKVLVSFWLESGCSQEEGEVCTSWTPVNFRVYHELFPSMIDEAVNEWLSENKLAVEQEYEVLFEHVIDQDPGGALLDEYFVPIHLDTRPAEAELLEALRDAVGLLEMHGINRSDLTPKHESALSRISKHKE